NEWTKRYGGENTSTSPTTPVYLPLAERIRIWPPGRRPSVSRRMLNMHFWISSVLVISRQTSSIDPRMKTRKTALSLAVTGSLLCLDAVLDLGQPAGPQGAVFGSPAVVNHLDRDAVEVQFAVAPFLLGKKQPGL